MLLNRSILLFVFLSIPSSLFAQKEGNTWVFGQNAGVEFDGIAVRSIEEARFNSTEAAASISDRFGNFLFATDGTRVINSEFQTMENGDDLDGSQSSAQIVILPDPTNELRYYIFYISKQNDRLNLNYALVSFVSNPLGNVILKNLNLRSNVTERLTWLYGDYINSFYIIASSSDTFFVYSLDTAGLNESPRSFKMNTDDIIEISQIKYNAARDLIANANRDQIEIMNWDRDSGAVQDSFVIDFEDRGDFNSIYSIEFSKSGRYLYASTVFDGIYQIDLQDLNSEDAQNSITQLLPINPVVRDNGVQVLDWALQIGPNDKIYVCHGGYDALGVLENPENEAGSVNYNFASVPLDGLTGISLPQLPPSFKFGDIITRNNCSGETVNIELITNILGTVTWNLGDGTIISGNPIDHIYSDSGTYQITATVSSQSGNITFSQEIEMFQSPPDLNNLEIIICNDDAISPNQILDQIDDFDDRELYEIGLYSSVNDAMEMINEISDPITLNDSTTELFLNIYNPDNLACSNITTLEITKENLDIDNFQELEICPNAATTIYAPEGFNNYQWSDGTTGQQIDITNAESISVSFNTRADDSGCELEVHYNFINRSLIQEIEARVVESTSSGNTIEILSPLGDDYEYAIDGISFQSEPLFENLPNGIYTITARDTLCDQVYSSEIVISRLPKFFTPNGDGFNDVWNPFSDTERDILLVRIFDRYGKLLTQLSPSQPSWDGTIDGQDLPSSDYWYSIIDESDKVINGHFTLKR
ncbi:T9SS type B sorting domain-containing protein [Nonlabens ponticola]|uniref:T9SS type B sorting domain-containing protein n=1 Tax=Nonlabens ponticola TaxID=2496866 RepID=A0A3S9MUF3_9FLAO|nr:T9SS type B sorting domain-containing protein [Nonlabens ponticola]AZQ42806.1 T9SS type B sorting domain-containing protein [Nonlabens ponticola]